MARVLCTLNLNGIRSAGRRGFLRWLKRARPDLLCLQELRAQPGDVVPVGSVIFVLQTAGAPARVAAPAHEAPAHAPAHAAPAL